MAGKCQRGHGHQPRPFLTSFGVRNEAINASVRILLKFPNSHGTIAASSLLSVWRFQEAAIVDIDCPIHEVGGYDEGPLRRLVRFVRRRFPMAS
jgi:hypothetical protein